MDFQEGRHTSDPFLQLMVHGFKPFQIGPMVWIYFQGLQTAAHEPFTPFHAPDIPPIDLYAVSPITKACFRVILATYANFF